jgi:hypothetical protein
MSEAAWLHPAWPSAEGWTAIFTGLLFAATCFLGWFTFKLWKATLAALRDTERGIAIAQQQADAAKLSADAAVGIELPRLAPSGGLARRRPSATAAESISECAFVIVLRNMGRNAAIVFEDSLAVSPDSSFGMTHSYDLASKRALPFGVETGSGFEYHVSPSGRCSIPLSDAMRLVEENEPFWAYGFVAYRDFLEQTWHSRFCFRILCNSAGGIDFEQETQFPSYTGRMREPPSS